MKTNRNLPIVAVLVVFFFATTVFSQVFEMSTKELTNESTAIIVGTCIEKQSYWNEERDQIFTRVRFTIEETIKGEAAGETEVLIPGGRVGNIIYEVSDMPIFAEGEESVVFLWRHPSGANLVTGALHGKLDIYKDKVSGKKAVRSEEDHKKKDREDKTELRLLDKYVEEIKGYMKE